LTAPTIETPRLILRAWAQADRPAYVALTIDPVVSGWLGMTATPESASTAFDRLLATTAADEHWPWALVRKNDDAIVGAISVNRVPPNNDHPMAGEIEIGWGLSPFAWGFGYASEGAAAALAWAFANVDLAEVVSFTAARNARSEAVMRRIGLVRAAERDFDHPMLEADHPLRPHVVYVARRPALQ
jgi:RimJ/RimL family protein N-acetyltransferase